MLQEIKAVKRRPVNLNISEDLIKEAKEYGVNASRAAEEGILQVLKKERQKQWREENHDAIAAYNKEIEERGMLYTPEWLEKE